MMFRRPSKSRSPALAVGSLLGLLLVISTLARVSQGAPRKPKVDNPHWKADSCAVCHTIENGRKLPISVKAADDICLKCHDGVNASKEFHPVGRQPRKDEHIKLPKDFPVNGDKLACLTCHDAKLACDEDPKRPATGNRMFLRNFQEKRNQSQPFCRNCHEEQAYQKLNPHQMLLVEKDEVVEDKCLFCHSKPLDRKTMARSGEPSLKADELNLCRDCHPQHQNPMPQGHIRLPLVPDKIAYMVAREQMGLSAEIPQSVIDQIKKAGTKPTMMFVGDNTIVCTTCHNPHQLGVFPKDSTLTFRAMRPIDDSGKLVSPVRSATWCRHCHAS